MLSPLTTLRNNGVLQRPKKLISQKLEKEALSANQDFFGNHS